MKDSHVKAIIGQWAIPFAILMVIILTMLVDFSASSKKREVQEVQDSLIDIVDEYAQSFYTELNTLTVSATTVASIVEEFTYRDIKSAQNMAYALSSKTKAYLVVFCNEKGQGINQYGNIISIKDTDYFPNMTTGRQQYLYTEDDGVFNEKAFITEVPLYKEGANKGFLLVYYGIDMAASLIRPKEFDTAGYYSIVNSAGQVMMQTGRESELYQGTDFWNTLIQQASNKQDITDTVSTLPKKNSGILPIEGKYEKQQLLYAPLGINDWFMVIGLKESYVENLQEREWDNARIMVVRLIVAILVFLGMLVIINIIARIRQDEKSKDLENKADSDLLTGLNNKSATERKIKEYLQDYPGEVALLFIMDIDNFKKINDTMGHAFGDEVLRTLGLQIRAEFRITDIIGRTGGDEFMIFLKDVKDDMIIERECRKMERFFKSFQAGEYVKYSATASIGAAVYPKDATDFDSLYKAADAALYKAKKRGKNQLAFYSDCAK